LFDGGNGKEAKPSNYLWKNKSMSKFKKLMHIFYKRRYGVILKKWYVFRIIVGYLQKFFF